MKKLVNLKGVILLNKSQQKNIAGGSGTCAAFVPCTLPGEHDDSCGGGQTVRNISKREALQLVSNGGNWCCESCGSATWY